MPYLPDTIITHAGVTAMFQAILDNAGSIALALIGAIISGWIIGGFVGEIIFPED